jgi:hypothetical protein
MFEKPSLKVGDNCPMAMVNSLSNEHVVIQKGAEVFRS